MVNNSNRRFSTRVATNIPVRFVLENGVEGRGTVIDKSATGLAIRFDGPVSVNDRIVVSAEEFGQLAGRVARVFSGGAAIVLECAGLNTTNGIAAAHEASAWPTGAGGAEKRRHDRIPCDVRTVVHVDDLDLTLDCVAINMSRSGCLLRSGMNPPLGGSVLVGKRRGVVRRHVENGFAVEFETVAPEQQKPAAASHCVAA